MSPSRVQLFQLIPIEAVQIERDTVYRESLWVSETSPFAKDPDTRLPVAEYFNPSTITIRLNLSLKLQFHDSGISTSGSSLVLILGVLHTNKPLSTGPLTWIVYKSGSLGSSPSSLSDGGSTLSYI